MNEIYTKIHPQTLSSDTVGVISQQSGMEVKDVVSLLTTCKQYRNVHNKSIGDSLKCRAIDKILKRNPGDIACEFRESQRFVRSLVEIDIETRELSLRPAVFKNVSDTDMCSFVTGLAHGWARYTQNTLDPTFYGLIKLLVNSNKFSKATHAYVYNQIGSWVSDNDKGSKEELILKMVESRMKQLGQWPSKLEIYKNRLSNIDPVGVIIGISVFLSIVMLFKYIIVGLLSYCSA